MSWGTDSDSSESDIQDPQLGEYDSLSSCSIARFRCSIGGVRGRGLSVGLFLCSFGGVKSRGVDPGEPSWGDSGMDVVDNEEVGEGGGPTGGDSGVPRTPKTYLSPSVWISSKRGLSSKGCLRRNFASLIDLGILAMIAGSMAIAAFISSFVYPRAFPLQQILA